MPYRSFSTGIGHYLLSDMKTTMMGKKLVTAGALLATGACGGLSVTQDFAPGTDFTPYQTYAWMENQNEASATGSDTFLDQRIRSAIDSEMQSKGYREAQSGEPDLRVGYHLILDEQVDYQTVNDYWGSGWGYGGVYGPAMMSSTSRTTEIRYTIGTLIVDIFGAESRSLIWRGSAEGEVHETNDPTERQERVNRVVAEIMNQFPPDAT